MHLQDESSGTARDLSLVVPSRDGMPSVVSRPARVGRPSLPRPYRSRRPPVRSPCSRKSQSSEAGQGGPRSSGGYPPHASGRVWGRPDGGANVLPPTFNGSSFYIEARQEGTLALHSERHRHRYTF